ncbi:MAG TPA: R3H domain-containing nucleic acid-binding protein [Candidatus Mcinerneyibacterium sp.]|nr:R3H domain-containing nucleic acid-binding protein [Candidatus Mcinerneyibacterium sp.]
MNFFKKILKIDTNSKIKKILEEVFNVINYDVELNDFDEYNGTKRMNLSYEEDDANVLVGKNGKNIMALETLINIILKKRLNIKNKIMLDVNNYRKKKDIFLKDIAIKAGEEVLKAKRKVYLKPMNAYERKVVHKTLQNIKNVTTKSIGKGKLKKIVVYYNNGN